MDLADGERDMVTAALASCREEQGFSRRIRQDLLTERQRRAEADRADHERLVRGLLTAAGIDLADLERRRERNTAHAQSFLDRQKRTIVDHSRVMAQRQDASAHGRGEGLAALHLFDQAQLGAFALTTLATASAINVSHAAPDDNNHVEVRIDPPAPERNFAKVYASRVTRPDVGFHVPGIWTVTVDWVFKLSVVEDVLLNAITFVQASGVGTLFASGWVLDGSFAEFRLRTRLRMFTPPPDEIQPLGTGDHDEGPVRSVRGEWWNILGEFDSAVYDFQSTLIDRSFSPAPAHSTVFFVVSVDLDLSTDGNAFGVADFFNGDLRINVPAVYVSTFRPTPIP